MSSRCRNLHFHPSPGGQGNVGSVPEKDPGGFGAERQDIQQGSKECFGEGLGATFVSSLSSKGAGVAVGAGTAGVAVAIAAAEAVGVVVLGVAAAAVAVAVAVAVVVY